MNRFDDYYTFRRATIEDCDMIMNFIADEWPKKNHILAVNKAFFLYEFQNGKLLNFIIAINRKTEHIDGMMGYIPSSDIKETLDIWTCMWLTRRNGSIPFLGLEVLNRMNGIIGYRYLTGVGTNPQTALPLARDKASHYEYKLKHFYRLSDCKEFKIAAIKNIIVPDKPSGFSQLLLTPARDITETNDCISYASQFSIPLKNAWYINKRFFRHPVYKYLIWKIIKAGQEKGLIVGREIEINGAKILRIVDFMGAPELWDGLYDQFELLINTNNYEYVDFYVCGIDNIHLERAGFVLKTETDPNIIPNYFEPFVQCNVDIYGTSTMPDVRMCKADADQDRPNFT